MSADAAPSPLIDVLIPAFNAAATVRDAVASIQAQTVRDIAIHVVDDGSTDDTPRILAEIAAADPRVLVHYRANGGIVDALNHGLSFCTAPLVARHDADDLAYPERLAMQADYLARHPDAVAVGAAARHIDAAGRPIGTVARLDQPETASLAAVPAREPYMIHPLLMVRRAALAAVGGYRHVHHAEDSDLYWRLQERGRLHNLPDILADYRMHPDSISGKSIVNGRVMAIGSQLAAFSARRRAAGLPDLSFAKAGRHPLEQAGDLATMLAIAARALEPTEHDAFKEAVMGKMLELTSYRPYELEPGDVRVVRQVADRGFAHLSRADRALQVRRLTGSAARLAASGRIRDAFAMVPPRLWPSFGIRWLFRSAMFVGLRRRRSRARNAPVK